jgi:hypothetical protein
MGAASPGELASGLEHAAADASWSDLDARVHDVESALDECISYLKEKIA